MAEKKKIIIDTDCGSDDAMAIAMALNDPNYEILMISTVSGNVRMKQATINTLTTLEYTDSYYPPVYEGCDLPLIRDWVGAAETHGEDGMGDIGLVPHRLKASEGNGVLKMLEVLREEEEKTVDIIALGPLTNLAVALRLDAETMRRADKIWVMGTSGLSVGNVSPVAEFNIWQDAEACKVVLDAGLDQLIFVGWDACCDDAMLTPAEIKRIRESGELGKFCIDSNRQLMELNVQRFGDAYLDMADPAAMAAALYPKCIDKMEKYYCEVETSSGPAYGAVLVDRLFFSGKTPNAYICSKLKEDLYKEYIYQTLHVK